MKEINYNPNTDEVYMAILLYAYKEEGRFDSINYGVVYGLEDAVRIQGIYKDECVHTFAHESELNAFILEMKLAYPDLRLNAWRGFFPRQYL